MGWLGNPKKRDELIEYARSNNRTECTVWLLDYKNRTADLAMEREKAEKKMLAELNASPNSVKMLQKIWSYKKREDGTLIITNYKGIGRTEVIVPEKIGRSTVTAIGNGAFAAASGVGAGAVIMNANPDQYRSRRQITEITLPNTLKYIGTGAFTFMCALKDIHIPEGVEEIDSFAFSRCDSLTSLTIPSSVKKIGMYAFSDCKNLCSVKIRGAVEIGAGAFHNTLKLESVELPRTVKKLLNEQTKYNVFEVFDSYSKVVVRCPKGSCAEEYCKRLGIKVIPIPF